MSEDKYKVVVDPRHGYRRLDPIPNAPALAHFYESQYYDLIREGGRAPEIRALMAGGEDGEIERSWLRRVLFGDIAESLKEAAPSRRVLNIGCRTGELLSALRDEHFEVYGLEPSESAARIGRELGHEIFESGLGDFAAVSERPGPADYHAVTLLNVLEHVPDPAETLRHAHDLLTAEGIVCVRVPNDFNDLQLAAQAKLQRSPWWIATPDHINYFDFESLEDLITEIGFEVIDAQSDFPMELFLLMGTDYIGDETLGKKCHHKRVELELQLPRAVRRRLYRSFAASRLGRNCLVFARKCSR